MKNVLCVAAFLLVGCASLPTNIADNSIEPTVVQLSLPKDKARARVLKLAALKGWKIDQNGDDMIVADDRSTKPGWLLNYNVRYIFTLSPVAEGTDVDIRGVAVLHGEFGPVVKDGRTSALKAHEIKAADALATP